MFRHTKEHLSLKRPCVKFAYCAQESFSKLNNYVLSLHNNDITGSVLQFGSHTTKQVVGDKYQSKQEAINTSARQYL